MVLLHMSMMTEVKKKVLYIFTNWAGDTQWLVVSIRPREAVLLHYTEFREILALENIEGAQYKVAEESRSTYFYSDVSSKMNVRLDRNIPRFVALTIDDTLKKSNHYRVYRATIEDALDKYGMKNYERIRVKVIAALCDQLR